jgi:hypothetical protein
MRSVGFASIVLLAVMGCSAVNSTKTFTGATGAGGNTGADGPSGAGNGNGGGITGLGGNPLGGAVGAGDSDCSVAATLVYVLAADNSLWSFDPPSKTFTDLFTINCPTPNDGNVWAPNSMAVDRNVVAWVNYVGTDPILQTDRAGQIFKVDINSMSCEPTAAVNLPSAEWYRLGMGYSTDTSGGTSETLYVTGTGSQGGASPGLGKISSTNTLVTMGQFTGDSMLTDRSAELTGTGDAKLYGFFTTTPVRVAQLDTASGAVISDLPVSGVHSPTAWAFSFWGGAFYLYTSADGTTNSTVTRFDPTTKAVDPTYNLTAPNVIVGAGVSTCAPITPPT